MVACVVSLWPNVVYAVTYHDSFADNDTLYEQLLSVPSWLRSFVDRGAATDYRYIVMQYCEAGDLEQALNVCPSAQL